MIRAMILTLHARACLSRGHRSNHIPNFTHLVGFVCGHVWAGPRGVLRESMDCVRAEVTECAHVCYEHDKIQKKDPRTLKELEGSLLFSPSLMKNRVKAVIL